MTQELKTYYVTRTVEIKKPMLVTGARDLAHAKELVKKANMAETGSELYDLDGQLLYLSGRKEKSTTSIREVDTTPVDPQ